MFMSIIWLLLLKCCGCEGVVAQWHSPLALQSVHSVGVGLIPGRTPPLEHHEKGSQKGPPLEHHEKGSISAELLLRCQRLALKTATSPSPVVGADKIDDTYLLQPFNPNPYGLFSSYHPWGGGFFPPPL